MSYSLGTSAKITLQFEGAVLEARNSKEQTSLYCLAEAGAVDTVRVLLEAGTDVNAVDSNGRSALWFAIQKPPPGHTFYQAWQKKKALNLPLIHLLLGHDADATCVDQNNETLLHTAATGPPAVLQYLLTLGSISTASQSLVPLRCTRPSTTTMACRMPSRLSRIMQQS
jgi:ankyrin repeat protein